MKRVRFLLLFLAFVTSQLTYAYDAYIDGIYYNLSETSATVTSGVSTYSGSITIPKSIAYDNKIYPVTSIGDNAFLECAELTNVNIPETVTTIGDYAFYCCIGLTSITIPESITSIGYYAFQYCIGISTLIYNARDCSKYGIDYSNCWFYGCDNISEVKIGDNVQIIPDLAFIRIRGISSINIPNSVISIGNYSFYGCSGMTSVTIGESVISIGEFAFGYCTYLKSINIPASVVTLGNWTFEGCTGLTDITIPESVTSIEEGTFADCSGLTSIIIPESVTSIGFAAFRNCSGLKNIIIPNSVVSVGQSAFWHCSGLTNVIIPNSVIFIGPWSFSECSGLTSISIPASVRAIGQSAFENCTGLTELYISADTIAVKAFFGLENLMNVYSLTSVPPVAPDNTFSSYTGITLHVPQGALPAYENATCWKNFYNIYEGDFSDIDGDFNTDNSTGYKDMEADLNYKVWTTKGCICIESVIDELVEIYSLQGTQIYRGYGGVKKSTSPGVYIVRINNFITKLIVK